MSHGFKVIQFNVIIIFFRCPLINAIDEIFNISYNEPKEFEEQVVNKIKSVYKTFDGDRYLSAALLNDRFLKSAQVNK